MNSGTTDRRRARLIPGRERHYEVGYGKPPVATRFQPGQSGNPLGRSKGSRNSLRPSLNAAQAVVRSLAVSAAKGDQRAQRLFTQLLAAIERDNKHLHDQWLESAINYKVEWERELGRRKKLGIEAPDPIPHPDHVVIDVQTGSVRITGPMTKEEKAVWDLLQEAKEQGTDLRTLLNRDPD